MTADDSSTQPLDRAAVAKVDPTDQIADVLSLPEQLRDAVFKVESAELPQVDSPGGLLVAGMGGSGIGGRLARGILGDQASRPILSSAGYSLPGWTTSETTVLCASYSGETEETLACFEAAGIIGTNRVVVTTGGSLAQAARAEGVPVIPVAGGLQPRAAVAYMTVAALEVAAACGAGPRLTTEVDVAADHLEQLAIEWGPDSAEDSLAKSLARSIHGTVPVIAGYGLTEAVASRWKTQVNENANQLAFASVLLELDHNEIVGWGSAANFGRFSAVFFQDSDDPQRIARRIELTRSLIEADGASVHVVSSIGQTAVERAFSLILLGDLFSTYLAICNQQDPADIAVITALKKGLAEQE